MTHSLGYNWSTKYCGGVIRQRQREVSMFHPLEGANGESGDRGLTVGDTIAAPDPTPETELEKKEEEELGGQKHLAKVDAQIAAWEQKIPNVRGEAKRETLQAILECVKNLRSQVKTGEEADFKVSVLHCNRSWEVSPSITIEAVEGVKVTFEGELQPHPQNKGWQVMIQVDGLPAYETDVVIPLERVRLSLQGGEGDA